MTRDQIRKTVIQLLSEIAPDAQTQQFDPNVSFHDQFEIDSIDFLRLMMGLEKELQVTIFDFDYPRLSTLKGCEDYLLARASVA